MNDEEEFPRRKKFYFGSKTNTPWNNDLFVKVASKTEQKMSDPRRAAKNHALWAKQHQDRVVTPNVQYDIPAMSVRSTGSRTAKKVRKSHGLKCIIRDELKDDIDGLKTEVVSLFTINPIPIPTVSNTEQGD